MPTALNALARCAMAIQTNRTTPAAVVRNFYPSTGLVAPTLTQPMVQVSESRGRFMPMTAGRNFLGRKLATYTFNGALNLEDLPWWGEMCFKGGISPTGGTGGAGEKTPYVWTYPMDLTSDTLKASTQYYEDDQQDLKLDNAICNGWSISGNAGTEGPIMVSAPFFAPNRATSSWTPPADSTRTPLYALMSTVSIDDTTFGSHHGTPTSAFAAGVESWSINYTPGFTPAYGCSGALTYEEPIRAFASLSASVTLRFNSDTDDEIVKWAAGTERLVRIEVENGILDNAVFVDDTAHKATFDLAGYWQGADPSVSGGSVLLTLNMNTHYTTAGSLSNYFKMIYTGSQENYTTA